MMRIKLFTLIGIAAMLLFPSCAKENVLQPDINDFPPDFHEQNVPMKDKPIMLRVDAVANFERFIQQDSVDHYLSKAQENGITDIVLDVRPVVGYVMYKGSKYATEMLSYEGKIRDNSWDYLTYFIQKSHALKLRIYAAVNTFTAGYNQQKIGEAYDNAEIGALTSLLNTPNGMVDSKNATNGTVFLNAADPQVQTYVLNIIKEIAERYPVDGIMLDRCRFESEQADFSPVSKELFQQYTKGEIKFPEDIFTWSSGRKIYGKQINNWYEWRASIIRDFYVKAKATVKAINPNIKFAAYVDGAYPTCYQTGENWASEWYNVSVDFPQWATLNYKKTGYAATLDYQIPTLNVKTLNGSDWTSVEGGLLNAKNITRGVVPIVGGLVGENYQSNPDDIRKAVVLCMTKAQGVIFQDLSELVRYNLWGKVNQGISEALGTKPVSKDVVIEKITRTINGKLIAGYSAIIDFRQNTNLKFNVLLPNVVTKPSVTMKTLPQEKGTPILAVNAGFFWLNASNSLVIIGGEHKAPNTPSMIRNGKTVYPVRSAIGLMPNGKFEITWVYNVSGNKTYSYPSALDNNEQTNTYMPAPPTAATAGAKEWTPIEAVGGGPRLLENGVNVAVANYWKEAFDAGGIGGLSNQPRTAVGVTADGKMIIIVIDGRRAGYSVGCTLSELTELFKEYGAVNAINLDGGGSSVMVGEGSEILTRPCEKDTERKVSSCIVISRKQ